MPISLQHSPSPAAVGTAAYVAGGNAAEERRRKQLLALYENEMQRQRQFAMQQSQFAQQAGLQQQRQVFEAGQDQARFANQGQLQEAKLGQEAQLAQWRQQQDWAKVGVVEGGKNQRNQDRIEAERQRANQAAQDALPPHMRDQAPPPGLDAPPPAAPATGPAMSPAGTIPTIPRMPVPQAVVEGQSGMQGQAAGQDVPVGRQRVQNLRAAKNGRPVPYPDMAANQGLMPPSPADQKVIDKLNYAQDKLDGATNLRPGDRMRMQQNIDNRRAQINRRRAQMPADQVAQLPEVRRRSLLKRLPADERSRPYQFNAEKNVLELPQGFRDMSPEDQAAARMRAKGYEYLPVLGKGGVTRNNADGTPMMAWRKKGVAGELAAELPRQEDGAKAEPLQNGSWSDPIGAYVDDKDVPQLGEGPGDLAPSRPLASDTDVTFPDEIYPGSPKVVAQDVAESRAQPQERIVWPDDIQPAPPKDPWPEILGENKPATPSFEDDLPPVTPEQKKQADETMRIAEERAAQARRDAFVAGMQGGGPAPAAPAPTAPSGDRPPVWVARPMAAPATARPRNAAEDDIADWKPAAASPAAPTPAAPARDIPSVGPVTTMAERIVVGQPAPEGHGLPVLKTPADWRAVPEGGRYVHNNVVGYKPTRQEREVEAQNQSLGKGYADALRSAGMPIRWSKTNGYHADPNDLKIIEKLQNPTKPPLTRNEYEHLSLRNDEANARAKNNALRTLTMANAGLPAKTKETPEGAETRKTPAEIDRLAQQQADRQFPRNRYGRSYEEYIKANTAGAAPPAPATGATTPAKKWVFDPATGTMKEAR